MAHNADVQPGRTGESGALKVIDLLKDENQTLRKLIRKQRIRISLDDKRQLGVKGRAIGRKKREEVATIARADTILGRFRDLVAEKWTFRCEHGGWPRTRAEIRELIVKMAKENLSWGHTRFYRPSAHCHLLGADRRGQLKVAYLSHRPETRKAQETSQPGPHAANICQRVDERRNRGMKKSTLKLKALDAWDVHHFGRKLTPLESAAINYAGTLFNRAVAAGMQKHGSLPEPTPEPTPAELDKAAQLCGMLLKAVGFCETDALRQLADILDRYVAQLADPHKSDPSQWDERERGQYRRAMIPVLRDRLKGIKLKPTLKEIACALSWPVDQYEVLRRLVDYAGFPYQKSAGGRPRKTSTKKSRKKPK